MRDNGKLPEKIFGVKYTRQPAPEHYLNPYLPAKAETKKNVNTSRRDAPSTPHSASAIKGSNDNSKHGIHFSLDLKLKCNVNASNIIPNEYNKIMPWDPLGYGQYQSDCVDGFRHQIWHCFGNTKLLLLILGKAMWHLDVYFVSMLNLAKFRMSHSKQNTPTHHCNII